MGHYIMIRKSRADKRMWDLTAATQAHRSPDSQREVWQKTQRSGLIGEVRKSSFEMCNTADERIGLIGSSISIRGDRWVKTHGKQMRWLAQQGVTPEEAVARHKAWIKEQMAHPFWVPANKKNPLGRK